MSKYVNCELLLRYHLFWKPLHSFCIHVNISKWDILFLSFLVNSISLKSYNGHRFLGTSMLFPVTPGISTWLWRFNSFKKYSVETSDDLQEIPLRRLIPCTHLAMDDPRQADNTTLGRVGSITRKPVPTPRASTLKKVGTKICCLSHTYKLTNLS